MKISFLICLLLGAMIVFQPAINRLILEQKGLSFAVFLNGSILFLSACTLFFVIFSSSERIPLILQLKSAGTFRLWFLLPGIMGFCLVVTVPIMIKNLGALPTILAMLLGQIITSLVWDVFFENVAINASRVVGLALAFVGAYLSFNKNA